MQRSDLCGESFGKPARPQWIVYFICPSECVCLQPEAGAQTLGGGWFKRSFSKMFPPVSFERSPSPWAEEEHPGFSSLPPHDPSDLRHFDPRDLPGYSYALPGGEEQLVILASVERLFQSCPGRDRQRCGLELRGHIGFLAKMRQVGG